MKKAGGRTSIAAAAALHDLGALRAALAERRRAEEAAATAERLREAQARERAEQAQRDRGLFAREVGAVQPLRKAALDGPARVRPAPIALQRLRDEAAVLVEAISDEFDVESLLDTDEALSFRRFGVGAEVVRKLRRGVWALQGEIDLHGLRREEARERVVAFLHEAVRCGWRCVRVVHGKGHGSPGREPVLKAKVKAWLAQRDEVMAFTYARPADGGHGALLVLLRPKEPHPR